WPTEGAVERLIAAHHEPLKALRIVSRDVSVERALGICSRKHVIRSTIIAADRIQQMHAGAVIARGTAPARVRQSTAKRVKRVAAVKRRINRVAPRAASRSLRTQRIRHLVSLVAEVEHVPIA